MTATLTSSLSPTALARRLGVPEPTEEQAAAIGAPLGPGVVVAGAGSGKTETMAARVVWLVANGLVEPGSVLGLTFTRKAAGELGRRIRRRLAQWQRVVEHERPDDVQTLAALTSGEPTVLTYAAYAGRLVREHALRLGAEPDARLLSEAVRWQLADAVVRRHPGDLPADVGALSSVVRWVLELSADCADHLVTPEQVERFCHDLLARWRALPGRPAGSDVVRHTAHRLALLPLVRAFAAAKASRHAVDFGDEAVLAARLAELPDVVREERGRYRAVLLDEYQDTGHAQAYLLSRLYGEGHPVTAVGDPLQSIYGWRGASSGTMDRFTDLFRTAAGDPAPVHPLATSWRNDGAVLAAANAVAAPLRGSTAAIRLRERPGAGPGSVTVAVTETVDDEARWVAERIAAEWAARAGTGRSAAVLVRRRAQIPALAQALFDAGLPVEVVGLGGLLTTPEVADVVATLRMVADRGSNTAAARILTGARWSIGPADLAALGARARGLVSGDAPAGSTSGAADRARLIEAVEDPGPPERYSAAGYARITVLRDELRRLRRRSGWPLTELVAEVARSSNLDIELLANRARATVGRVHLDRFLDETAAFAAEADEATLGAFLAYLDAAEQEENGLEAGEVVVAPERVQIVTVHGAKGLEWDVVAVPGLVDKVFPAAARSIDWTTSRHRLPAPLRGDRDDLPLFTLSGATTRSEATARLAHYRCHVAERHLVEERRLAYVAITRARSTLLLSGYAWDTTKSPRAPSPFLEDVRPLAHVAQWFVAPDGATNPVTAMPRTARWPTDPLAERRAAVEHGAELVRDALCRPAVPPSARVPGPPAAPAAPTAPAGLAARWRRDVDLLLAERERLTGRDTIPVPLPERLSVSQLVTLARDPDELARQLSRPLPARPAPLARRGTRFHLWLEERWQCPTLLDIDELPGAADEGADDRELLALQEAFERSAWGSRTPTEVEVPFEMTLDGRVLRGRMDAVFGDAEQGWTVLDWKTGAEPRGAVAARAAAVQLAVYRLAWAALARIPEPQLHRVSAAFHYVRSGRTVAPADLLDAAGLRALLSGCAPEPGAERQPGSLGSKP